MTGRIAVLKFGGTCLESPASRRLAGDRIIAARTAGWSVVAVVSAMGRAGAPYATDTLLEMVRAECPGAASRELATAFVCGELLSAAVVAAHLRARGVPATCLNGRQAGILTTPGSKGEACMAGAEVAEVRAQSLLDMVRRAEVPVVAGSQGCTAQGDVTTLGRGGSDTSAAVLGVALDARLIAIYTDTPGIMTADPRLVPEARTIPRLGYQACERLAALGARVIHPKAVRIAGCRPDIPLYVRGLGGGDRGTLVGGTGWPCLAERGRPLGLAVAQGRLRWCARGNLYEWTPDGGGEIFVAGGGAAQISEGGRAAARLSIVHEGQAPPKAWSEYGGALPGRGVHPLAYCQAGDVYSVWVPGDQAQAATTALHALLPVPGPSPAGPETGHVTPS